MTTAAASFEDETGLWTIGVPRLGFMHPCICSLILAFSAYHLAKSTPSKRGKLLELAERHSTAALRSAAVLLGQLDDSSSAALYIVSVLVCFTTLAKGPSPGHLIVVASEGQVSWLSLLRGVKLVVSTKGWSSIFSGPLENYAPKANSPKTPAAALDTPFLGVEDWRVSLDAISDLVATCSDQDLRTAYCDDLKLLIDCFETTFGKGKHSNKAVNGELQVVISWLYQLEDSFLQAIQRGDLIPLILLGHFCVLLETLRRFWFVSEWPSHVIKQVLKTSIPNHKWLAWPRHYLEC